MRIILFTGKGGVGKTTVAAATALQSARSGHKTLVISTDPAHSLSDALNHPLSPEPVEIEPNLYGQELDVYYSMRKYWGNMRELMLSIFRWQGLDSVLAEEMSAIPGMEEGSAFLWIEKYYSEKAYDVIIIDSAPTGETLTLLTLPQVTKWWVSKAFPFQRLAIKTLGRAVRGTMGIPLDKGYEELENLFAKLEKIQKVFSDPNICSIRLVANPERMVIQEAKRAYTYLQLYGYNVDAVVVNRILPEIEGNHVFSKYIQSQARYLEEIKESFAPLPIFKVGHLGEEVFGLNLLSRIAQSVYENQDPITIFHKEQPFKIIEKDNGYDVKIKLPFITQEDIKVKKFGDELVLEVGARRKNIFLPKFSNFMEMGTYRFKSPWLTVRLEKRNK